jgi:hypothetical protein
MTPDRRGERAQSGLTDMDLSGYTDHLSLIHSFTNEARMANATPDLVGANELHRGTFWQFAFRWIYCYGSNKSTGKETGKTHLCELGPPKELA